MLDEYFTKIEEQISSLSVQREEDLFTYREYKECNQIWVSGIIKTLNMKE